MYTESPTSKGLTSSYVHLSVPSLESISSSGQLLCMPQSCSIRPPAYSFRVRMVGNHEYLCRRLIGQEIALCPCPVLRYCISALLNSSVFNEPSGATLSMSIRLIPLTPSSALQLLWGCAADDNQCCIPQSLRNWTVFKAVNWLPPSDDNSSGIPNTS